MNIQRNIILCDCNLDTEFLESLEQNSELKWQVLICDNRKNNIKRILSHFIFPLKIFLFQKNLSNILCWQQFYGILLGFYCRLFRVKKTFKLIVMTFIYKERKGILGKIYFKFVNYALSGNYIDKIIVFSKKEIDYYSNIFKNTNKKYFYIPLGISKIQNLQENQVLKNEKYILSVGRSNRDYDFLVESLSSTNYNVKIITDNYFNNKYSNIQIFNNTFGMDMFYYMKNCFCVVIPLANPNISAGQLVILQAMQLGKPVIATKSDGVLDYITNGINGYIIKKESLLSCIDKLYSDKNLYLDICNNAKKNYEQNFSIKKMGINLAKVLRMDRK